MIDLKQLRDAPDTIKARLATRYPELAADADAVLAIDEKRRALVQRVEAKKAERNSASEEVARRKKAGKDAGEVLSTLKALSASIKEDDQELKEVEHQLRTRLLTIPNLLLDRVPVGDASANAVIKTWGEPPAFSFEPAAHWDLAEQLRLIDLPRGAKVAGSGFPVYTRWGARMVRSLVSFMLDLHVDEHGYAEVWPPALVNEDSALGTGQLPDLEGQMYAVSDDLYLVPTAEVPVTNLHRDEILAADELPLAYAAYSPCFRREAGAHGKDTRGIRRVHQFDKVELVQLCEPEASPDIHERMLAHVEAVLQRLEIPYRVVVLATGDTGFASACTYDLEVWAAGVGDWLEASSASTFTDFQARRANIRYRPAGGGKPAFVHTLNASGLALPRTIIALLENNQQDDGSVVIPEALRPYLGTDRLTRDAQ